MKSFWQNLAYLKKPFFALAPMEKATDSIFRQVIVKTAKPDVYFTEFTNVEGMFSPGKAKVNRRLRFTESERPLIAQIWGLKPEYFYKAAMLLNEMGFDGIDINMGCPESKVTAKGSCAALINNRNLASEIIEAVKSGSGKLPVSVKTRIGYSVIQTEDWIGFLLEQNLDALCIHARTRKEMSKVPAHYDELKKAVILKNKINKNTVIIGNGDVLSVSQGIQLANDSGVDGVMLGRGVFENAWVFSLNEITPSISDRIGILMYHLKLYEKEKGEKLPYNTLKKYFKIYIRDFEGAAELRAKLMSTNNLADLYHIISNTELIR